MKPQTAPSTATDPVISALSHQVQYYGQLLKLAETQHQFVQQGNFEELLAVLEKRQAVLDLIGPLEQVTSGAKRRWSDFLAGLDAQQRTLAEQLMGQTRQLLEAITTADRNDTLVLQQRKLNVSNQLSQAAGAARVNQSYARSAYGQQSSRLDRVS
jgi:hypothetical protein